MATAARRGEQGAPWGCPSYSEGGSLGLGGWEGERKTDTGGTCVRNRMKGGEEIVLEGLPGL